MAGDQKINEEASGVEGHVALQSAIDTTAVWSAKWILPLSVQKPQVLHLVQQINRKSCHLHEMQLGSQLLHVT